MATYESQKYATIPIAATQVADGSVTNAEYQFINTVSSNVQTQLDSKLRFSRCFCCTNRNDFTFFCGCR